MAQNCLGWKPKTAYVTRRTTSKNMLSIKDKKIYYKYLISFALSSVIPLLVLFYLVSEYIFPALKETGEFYISGDDISLAIILTVFSCLLGFFLALDIIKGMERLSNKVKKLSSGETKERLSPHELSRKDEIGIIANNIEILLSSARNHTDKLNFLVAELEEAKKKIQELVIKLNDFALMDELTGFFNRKYLDYRLPSEIRRAELNGKKLGFIMLDVDNFAGVIQKDGEEESINYLQKLAWKFPEWIRDYDVIARFGDDEFAFLLLDVSYEKVREIAEKIRKVPQDLNLPFTVSLGGAFYPEDGKEAGKIVLSAVEALEKAKRSGKNRVVFYS